MHFFYLKPGQDSEKKNNGKRPIFHTRRHAFVDSDEETEKYFKR
jgi:hypothetical protein